MADGVRSAVYEADSDADINPNGLDFVVADSRCNLLENKVALAVPDGNPKGILSYEDLKAALEAGTVLMAMGNEDVPVGQYTQKIFAYFELNEEELAAAGCLTCALNTRKFLDTIRIFVIKTDLVVG